MVYFPAEFTLAIMAYCTMVYKDFVTAIIMGKCSDDELNTRIDAPEGVTRDIAHGSYDDDRNTTMTRGDHRALMAHKTRDVGAMVGDNPHRGQLKKPPQEFDFMSMQTRSTIRRKYAKLVAALRAAPTR
jgi:hypothetical protein